MSKVLREKVGFGPDRDPTTCSWVRFDPSSYLGHRVVGYDFDPSTWITEGSWVRFDPNTWSTEGTVMYLGIKKFACGAITR